MCFECLMSKQTRNHLSAKLDFSTKKLLKLVHTDLCGPITSGTTAGTKYVFLLLDDYSRAMWIYLLKKKSEAFSGFKKFSALVEVESERKIKVFRTNKR